MKKAILLIFILMMVGVVFATPEYYFKSGDVVDLKVPCINNNEACSGASSCNLTVAYPNGSSFINNQQMTNSGTYHNYTFTNSNIIGEYQTTVFCTDAGEKGYNTFSFEINRKGNNNETNLIGVIIGFLILIIFFFIMGYIEKFWFLQWASHALAFIELIVMAGVIYINEMGGELSLLLRTNFYIMALIGFGLIIITIFFNAVVLAAPDDNSPQEKKQWDEHMVYDKWDK